MKPWWAVHPYGVLIYQICCLIKMWQMIQMLCWRMKNKAGFSYFVSTPMFFIIWYQTKKSWNIKGPCPFWETHEGSKLNLCPIFKPGCEKLGPIETHELSYRIHRTSALPNSTTVFKTLSQDTNLPGYMHPGHETEFLRWRKGRGAKWPNSVETMKNFIADSTVEALGSKMLP